MPIFHNHFIRFSPTSETLLLFVIYWSIKETNQESIRLVITIELKSRMIDIREDNERNPW